MADQLSERVASMKITATEDNIVELGEIEDEAIETSMNMAVVGKVITMRSYNFEALKRTLNQIWSLTKDGLFRQIENGLFVIQFAVEKDKSKVMEGRPWTFDNNLVLLEEIDGSSQPSNIPMQWCPFWLRLYNLPMNSRSERAVRAIGGCLGDVMEVESDGIAWDKSARLKVRIDITKPLRRIQKIKARGGEVAMIEIKYERLPTFCYECGIIGHIERDCQMEKEEEDVEEKQWGTWLRASPRRGRLKMMEESKAFLRSNRKLCFVNPTNRVGVLSEGGGDVDTRRNQKEVRGEEAYVVSGALTGDEQHNHGNRGKEVPSFQGLPPLKITKGEKGAEPDKQGSKADFVAKEKSGEDNVHPSLEPFGNTSVELHETQTAYEVNKGDVVRGSGNLNDQTKVDVDERGSLVVGNNFDTPMEEISVSGQQEGRKWTRVVREKGGQKCKIIAEKQEGKTRKRERDKMAVEEEMSKKRAVGAAESVVAGPTPWALGDQ